MDSKLLNVTGLWKNEDSKGNTYLAGNWGNVKVLIFVNKSKDPNSKQPDYNMCIAPQEKKEVTEKVPF